jgi:lysophospholipase L1-like esterase
MHVALGDSTVYGLGASSPSTHYVARLFWRLHSEYPLARLLNRGACLATTDVLAHQVPDAIMDRPQLVTLSVGPNDLRQGCSPQDFAGRTEVILERLQRDTDPAVILNALPDLALSPRFREPERSMVAALTRHYNHALQYVADDFGL